MFAPRNAAREIQRQPLVFAAFRKQANLSVAGADRDPREQR